MKVNLHDFWALYRFLIYNPKAQATKENIDALDFIEIKNICASEDMTLSRK